VTLPHHEAASASNDGWIELILKAHHYYSPDDDELLNRLKNHFHFKLDFQFFTLTLLLPSFQFVGDIFFNRK
jgi:hypothetical protein